MTGTADHSDGHLPREVVAELELLPAENARLLRLLKLTPDYVEHPTALITAEQGKPVRARVGST